MRLNCIHCDRPLAISSRQLGTDVVCPHCGGTMRPPSAVAAHDGEQGQPVRGGGWRRTWISGLVSFFVHFTALLVLALVITNDHRGAGPGRASVLCALESEQLTDLNKGELDLGAAEKSVLKPQQDQLDEKIEAASPVDLAADRDAAEVDIRRLAPSGASGGGAAEIGAIGGGGGALGKGASFMGVHAQGRRFVIIADRSGSMAGPKVEYVKQEVLEALSTMRAGSQFQLIFFNGNAVSYPKPGWRNPEKDKAGVEQWMRDIMGEDGTYPVPAFEMAFKLEPAPDVIFFMTDGLFDADVVDKVAAMNRRSEKRVVIHTISFVDRSAEALMRRIAKESGGTYRHVAGF